MKTAFLLLTSLSLAWSTPLTAQALNRYDALSRTLTPLATVFAPHGEKQALSFTLVLEKMTGLPPEFAGTKVDLALQPPFRFRVNGQWGETPVAFCRVEHEIWVTPGSRFAAFGPPREEAGEPAATPAKEGEEQPDQRRRRRREDRIPPVSLPFPPEQLALLPVLFIVEDEPSQGGLRVLNVRFMETLAKQLKVENWQGRLFLDESDPNAPRLMRVELARPGWELHARVDDLTIGKSLPPHTWQPKDKDVLRLDGRAARQWIERLGDLIPK